MEVDRATRVDINSAVKLWNEDSIGLIEVDWPPVNALSQPVREGLLRAIEQAVALSPQAIVLICKGQTFFAGADISEFGKPFEAPTLDAVQRAFEASPIPIVAAIHGTALGGGLEVALACHYRIAVPSARLGLPEVSLGLLPGAGGTQRTPRLIGVAAAIDMIAGGVPVSSAKALDMGLIDAIVEGADLRAEAIAFAKGLAGRGAPLPLVRDRAVDVSVAEAEAAVEAYRAANARQFVGYRALGNILKAIVAAASLPFEEGLKREVELFDELMASDESAARRYVFFAERSCAKIPDLPKKAGPRPLVSTGVIGAGTMGTGIALALLGAGYPVVLVDQSDVVLAKARSRISQTIGGMVKKGRLTAATAEAQVNALTTATVMTAVADCDLVIEAVFERLDLKKTVFAELDGVVKAGAVLATNTSYLDVDAIAAATTRPHDVVGLHFFAPANIMRLLEVVRGDKTADDTLATAMQLGRTLRKLAVVSGVCDGFIANRLMARRSEAADRLLLQGASVQAIDGAQFDYGFPMGPYRMFDLVGLDVVGWDRENSAGRTVQEILCEAGDWGQKTGSGYYDYSQGEPRPSVRAVAAIEAVQARSGLSVREWSGEEINFALLDPVVNEGAKLVEEGMVYRASDIDMALIAGYGWPVYRGGPMFWGDTVGLDRIVARLDARAAAGEAIAVSPLLRELAAAGKRLVRD